jgi:histidyl-tRNA synthetase
VLEEKLAKAGCSDLVVARIFEVLKFTDLDMLRSEFHGVAALRDDFSRLASYFEMLDALGVRDWVVFDLSIVRGLAYYTGIVFELFDARGEFRAIAGGGRYDNLIAQLGGGDIPALGFGMGDVVLGELLRARKLMPRQADALDYWVAGAEGASDTIVMRVATALRRRKLRVEYPLREQKLSKQIKTAATAGAAKVLIIHDDRTATIRRLADGHEESVGLADLLDGAGDGAGDPWVSANAP